MPSVGVNHEGSLHDLAAQNRLAERIRLIARWVSPSLRASTREFDQRLEGKVLADLGYDEDDRFTELQSAHVAGADLVLMDFREDFHRFPFTFIREVEPDNETTRSLLNRITLVEDREECQHYRNPRIREMDWYLQSYGATTLRYHLEYAYDVLMAYVKQFHVPDLYYWRYGKHPAWTEYQEWVRRAQELPRGDGYFERGADLLKEVAGQEVRKKKADEVKESDLPDLSDTLARLEKGQEMEVVVDLPSEGAAEVRFLDLPEEVARVLADEGTVEALATGLIITMLRAADYGWTVKG